MIKKSGETGNDSNKSSFKRFSDMNSSGPKPGTNSKEASQVILPDEKKDIPCNPNIPKDSGKTPKGASTRSLRPLADKQNYDKEDNSDSIDISEKVKIYGKVAKLPKGTKASKGFNFLENVKISKNSIWYIMVERQGNELQMVKYNHKKGVDLSKFITDLKSYYVTKCSKNEKLVKLIESIEIDGNDKYTWIKNVPLIELEGKKMISKITEDLIKLLSK